MNIVNPFAVLWHPDGDMKSHIVRCAKVCYKSDREVDVDKFIEARIKAGHLSILRHGTKYYRIPVPSYTEVIASRIYDIALGKMRSFGNCNFCWHNDAMYVAANMQLTFEEKDFFDTLKEHEISEKEAKEIIFVKEEIFRYTFYLQTQISTSRELNRVSPNNILEESTRYVEEGSICRPWWCDDSYILNKPKMSRLRADYYISCEEAFIDYKRLIKKGLDKQDARGVLPLDTCTHVVYTYSINEWRNIINKRYFGTTGAPHRNCIEIVGRIKKLLEEEGYEFKVKN